MAQHITKEQLEEFVDRYTSENSITLSDKQRADILADMARTFGLDGDDPKITKTFRIPGSLLNWLEDEAIKSGRRSINAEIVEVLKEARSSRMS